MLYTHLSARDISSTMSRLLKNLLQLYPRSYSSIKDVGGKWADLQKAREGQYFAAQNNKLIKYIRDELKKGRKIDDVLEEIKKQINEAKEDKRNS